ncbi:hypothetical protein D3C73_1330090 [compost metagenome]
MSALQLIQPAADRRNLIHNPALAGCRLIQPSLQLPDAGHQLLKTLGQRSLTCCRFGITGVSFGQAGRCAFQLAGNLAEPCSKLRSSCTGLSYGTFNRLVIHILEQFRMTALKPGEGSIQTA